MAFALMLTENLVTTITLLSIAMFCCYSEAADGELQGQSLVKALSCFENKLIYVGCGDAYRLNPSGNINVPPEATDFFCSGPCLTETQQLLDCLDDIFSSFMFFNKATVQQMRYAINAGCSYSRQRGNFNLEDYIGGDTSNTRNSLILIRSYLFVVAAAAVYLVYVTKCSSKL